MATQVIVTSSYASIKSHISLWRQQVALTHIIIIIIIRKRAHHCDI